MPNVYVEYIEPEPKQRPVGAPISHYVLEFAQSEQATRTHYLTQAAAVTAAKKLGHTPLVARVRNAEKGNPDHWRAV